MRNPSVTTRRTWKTFRIRNLNLNLARPYGRLPGTWNVAGLVWSGNSNFETLMDVDALETWDGKAAKTWAPTANGRGIWIDLGMDMFPLTKRMQEDLPLMRWCGARKPGQQKACKDFGAGLSTISQSISIYIIPYDPADWYISLHLVDFYGKCR